MNHLFLLVAVLSLPVSSNLSLVYRSVNIKGEADIQAFIKADYEADSTDFSIVNVSILDDTLSIKTNSRLGYQHIERQVKEDVTILLDGTHEISFDQFFPNGIIYQAVESGEAFRYILSERCTSNDFLWGNMSVKVWTSNNFTVEGGGKYGKLFNRYFLEDQLVFAYYLYYKHPFDKEKNALSYFELVDVKRVQ